MDIWMDAALIIALAVIIDFVIGEVPNAIHPLRWMGDILYWIDRHISRKNPTVTRLMGFLSYLFILILFGGVAFLLSAATKYYLGEVAWIIVTAILFKVTFAISSFRRHLRPIRKDLEKGNIENAASKLQMIVSRNTKGMDEGHIVSSCTETVSENYVDSVVSPTTYFGIFGLIGAIAFRCANLMDAMWGYLNDKYRHLGTFPARFDDVLGFVTSRTSIVFITIGAFILRMDWRAVIPAALREHSKTPSPNSGWSMTAFAAALGISMEKKGVYVMGTGPMPTVKDMERCCLLVELSSIIYIAAAALPLYMFCGIHIQGSIENLFIQLFEVLA